MRVRIQSLEHLLAHLNLVPIGSLPCSSISSTKPRNEFLKLTSRFYGVSIIQFYNYCDVRSIPKNYAVMFSNLLFCVQTHWKKDRWPLNAVVGIVMILDTAQQALMMTATYEALVKDFGHFSLLHFYNRCVGTVAFE